MSQGSSPEAVVLRTLDELAVPYERLPCDPALADTAAFCEHYGYPVDHAANAILVATRKEPLRYALCVVLATTRLDVNRTVRDLLDGGRVSFASAEQMRRLTGMEVGGVTPFALPADLPVYVDAELRARSWVLMGTGGRTSKVKISPTVFDRVPNARFVDGLAHSRGE